MPDDAPTEPIRPPLPNASQTDDERAQADGDSQLGVLKEHGLEHGEALLHFEEFMETSGDTVAPTIDPPSHASPSDSEDTGVAG